MATQFPIDPEYNRFVGGNPDQNAESGGKEEAQVVDMPAMDDAELEELPDGSVVVTMDTKGPMEDEDFYQNLSDSDLIQDYELGAMALRYIELVEKDKDARKQRDKQYEEGIKRTGMGNDAPGGANFNGASKVVHPVMAETCIDFAARAIKEMFPPDGPPKPRSWATSPRTKRKLPSANATS